MTFHRSADIYYLAFPRDRRALKSAVAFVFTIELLQVILATRDCFKRYGSGWGNIEVYNKDDLLWLCLPVFDAIGEQFDICVVCMQGVHTSYKLAPSVS